MKPNIKRNRFGWFCSIPGDTERCGWAFTPEAAYAEWERRGKTNFYVAGQGTITIKRPPSFTLTHGYAGARAVAAVLKEGLR